MARAVAVMAAATQQAVMGQRAVEAAKIWRAVLVTTAVTLSPSSPKRAAVARHQSNRETRAVLDAASSLSETASDSGPFALATMEFKLIESVVFAPDSCTCCWPLPLPSSYIGEGVVDTRASGRDSPNRSDPRSPGQDETHGTQVSKTLPHPSSRPPRSRGCGPKLGPPNSH